MATSTKHADIVVAGGGTAGVIAAIAAARQGADTLLIEQSGTLGGTSTAGMINFYNSFHNLNGKQVIGGIPFEVVERLVELGATPGAHFDYSGLTGSLVIYNQRLLELLLFEMLEESGARLLLHSFVYDVVREGEKLQSALIANKSGSTAVSGELFVDATGDGDLAFRAGAPFEQTEAEKTQPVTLEFRAGGIDADKVRSYIAEHPQYFELVIPPEEIYRQKYIVQWCVFLPELKRYDEEGKLKYGLTHNQIWFNTHEPEAGRGIFTFNATRVVGIDGTDADALTRAQIDARKQIPILIEFFRAHVPGFENMYLLDIASQLGVRETRRIVGDYTITKEDTLEGRTFEDRIAKAVSQIDIHGSNLDEKKFFWTKLDKSRERFDFDIPYRALLPQGLDNLYIAGRPISSTRQAHGAIRFMPPCMAIGEAAGVAAALCAAQHLTTRELSVPSLQEVLLAQGVIL